MIGHDPRRTYPAAVIGSGSGGLTVAIGLARTGRPTVLIEGGRVGGDCTNVGCIPSKALLHAARRASADPLARVRRRRDELHAREDRELRDDEHVHLVRGWARLTGRREPHEVVVDGPDGERVVRAEHVVIAAGSRPVALAIPGVSPERVLTNETVFEMPAVPSRLLIVGGGATALEMATAFSGLGSEVHVVEVADRLLPAEDPLASEIIEDALVDRGVRVRTATSVARAVEPGPDGSGATVHLTDGTTIDGVERVLTAVGRRPHLDRLALDEAGVEHSSRGIAIDDWGRTSVPGIWAVGDVTGVTFTSHGASSVGRRVVRAIALPRLPLVGARRAVPNAVYTDPEIASVGLPPAAVAAIPDRGRRRYVVHLADIDRGFTDELRHGAVAVDLERGTGRVLRATIVGPSAAELIGIFTLAVDQGIGVRKLFGMVHPYPAHAEAIGRIADDFAFDTYPRLPQEWWAGVRARWSARRTASSPAARPTSRRR